MLYLYDSYGEWIAVKKDEYLFSIKGEWIGWFPKDDGIAVDLDRNYLGTIYQDDRFLYNRYQFRVFTSQMFRRPFGLGYIEKPFTRKDRVMILGTEDVDKKKLGL